MNRLAGQAGRTIGGFLQLLVMFFITLFLVLAVLLGGLAYRLSRGPLQIPWVTTLLANAVSGEDIDIHVGQAALGWAGYKNGGGAPLYLQLNDITVHNAGGLPLAAIPDARLSLTPSEFFGRKSAIYVISSDARFAGADVPVSLLAGIHLGHGFGFERADLSVTLGAGQLGPPGLAERLASARFLLTLTPKDARLTDGQFILPPFGDSAPVIRVTGTAHRDADWHGTLDLAGNAIQAQDLPHFWPPLLVPQTRNWVTKNITAGTADAPDFTLALSAPGHLSNLQLDNARGGFKARNLVLQWIPHAQPITQLSGAFTLTDPDDIYITADRGMLGGIALSAASLHIAGVAHRDQTGTLHIPISGTVQSAYQVLNAPPLQLLKAVPAPLLDATGDLTGAVDVLLPFKNNLRIDEVGLQVTTALTNVTVPLPLKQLQLDQSSVTVISTTKQLNLSGTAMLTGQPSSITARVVFGPPNAAAAIRFEMQTAVTAKTLTALGLDPNASISGEMPLDIRVVTTAANGGSLAVNADLTKAALNIPIFGWTKPAGVPGKFAFSAGINGDRFSGISRFAIDAKAPRLEIDAQAAAAGINFSRIHIGNTEGSGRLVPPANAAAPWQIDVFGNMLDASYLFNPAPSVTPQPPAPKLPTPKPATPSGFRWRATAHFDHLILAKAAVSQLGNFDFDGSGKGNSVFTATATGLLATGQPVNLAIAPLAGTGPGDAEHLQLQTADGGELLRAIGAYGELRGGALDLNADYGNAIPLSGTTTLTDFRLLKAPAVAKLLEAITVLGLPSAASGPGMAFRKLVAPFSADNGVMALHGARAYSASLGFTASGTIDLNAGIYDIHGTVVPAYALNALPGKIPLIGRLFSPEKGGGLFAMGYTMTGATTNPKITVNPLSALTPGFLRGIFGLGHDLAGK